jgi:uncharacterized protein (TIGR02444 family)
VSEQKSRFWRFSLSVYADAGVQAECLDLQDRFGIDVNLLLFCAYVGAGHGALLPQPVLQEAAGLIADWHNTIVRSLRTARRALKQFAADRPAAAELRGGVKAAELEAERLEQLMLEAWSGPRIAGWPRAEPEAAVAANIRTLFAAGNGAARQAGPPRQLIAAALAAAPGI